MKIVAEWFFSKWLWLAESFSSGALITVAAVAAAVEKVAKAVKSVVEADEAVRRSLDAHRKKLHVSCYVETSPFFPKPKRLCLWIQNVGVAPIQVQKIQIATLIHRFPCAKKQVSPIDIGFNDMMQDTLLFPEFFPDADLSKSALPRIGQPPRKLPIVTGELPVDIAGGRASKWTFLLTPMVRKFFATKADAKKLCFCVYSCCENHIPIKPEASSMNDIIEALEKTDSRV
ncbi:MAG: hypothetical protein MPL62_14305 [Alphaproteobacteria bacterium]|nr:hypothetical protein [Alphaproteobacteria bacterium]